MDEKKSEQFFNAVKKGNLQILEQLSKDSSVDLNWKNENGATAFHFACKKGRIEITKFFLGLKGIDLNAQNERGETPFLIACAFGHVEVVSLFLVDQRIDVSRSQEDGFTPFVVACGFGHVEVVSLLMADQRIDINKSDDDGMTPFFVACFVGHADVVSLLLADQRLEINQSGPGGMPPLMFPCMFGHVDVVSLLLADQRFDINKSDNEGMTPLIFACFVGRVEVVSLLLAEERISDLNIAIKGELTPLLTACSSGRESVVSILLVDPRVDVNKPNDDGMTPLWAASFFGHLSVVQQILASGRQIDTKMKGSKSQGGEKTTAAEQARFMGFRVEKDETESDLEFQRRQVNCPKIADLIEAYEKDPEATTSRLRVEYGSHGWTNRRKRQAMSDPEERKQKSLKQAEKIKPMKSTEPLQSMLQCSLCQGALKNPKTLPCVHSFCLECLEKQTQKAKSPFRCGLCTAPFVIPIKGLGSLGTFPPLAEMLSSSSSTAASIDTNDVRCQVCEGKEEASIHCTECNEFIGPQCLTFHQKFSTTKHHQLQTIDDYFAKSVGSRGASSSAGKRRCGEHPNQEIDTYCRTCKAIVCTKCLAFAHSGHESRPLNGESERLKGELIDMAGNIVVREKEAEDGRKNFVQSLGMLDEGRKNAEDELKKAFELLHSEIDQRQAEMLVNLQDGVHRVEKVIQLEKGEVEFALAEFKGYREMNEALVSGGNEAEVAAGHSMLMSRGKTLDEIGLLHEPTQKPEIRFSSKNLEAVKQAISTFGEIE